MKKKPTKLKAYYYEFWLTSSRGTDATVVRLYTEPQSEAALKEAVEEWCSGFGAWEASENVCSYGSRELKGHDLPRSRQDCLNKHGHACARHSLWAKRVHRYRHLLALPPFNGRKILQIN